MLLPIKVKSKMIFDYGMSPWKNALSGLSKCNLAAFLHGQTFLIGIIKF
jgi:hypothetical protein